jgi:hypothetical protein
VTAGPGYRMAAGRGGLRASRADRDQVIEVLKIAFVQGRLTKDELDVRLGQVFASRTYADLAAVTVDIPTDLVRVQPVRAQDRPPMSNAVKAAICVTIAAATLAVTFFTNTYAFAMFTFFYLMASLVAAAQILSTRHDKRSRRSAGQKLAPPNGVGTSTPRPLWPRAETSACSLNGPGGRVKAVTPDPKERR